MEISIENYGVHSLDSDKSAIAIAKELAMENIKQLCAVAIGDEVHGLSYMPKDGEKLQFLTFADEQGDQD